MPHMASSAAGAGRHLAWATAGPCQGCSLGRRDAQPAWCGPRPAAARTSHEISGGEPADATQGCAS
eukprot:1347514-Pyramimonas_sp.AAC.1